MSNCPEGSLKTSLENTEIVLIDDGSTDYSYRVCYIENCLPLLDIQILLMTSGHVRKEEAIMKFSIIICVYNTAKPYLDECLQSIFESTLSVSEYEVIIVDDGSTIGYSDLTARYSVRYYKTENKGPLCARIYGTNLARGEYVAYVDSDDVVSCNYHLPMLRTADRCCADIVINGWAFKTDRSCRTCYKDTTMAKRIDSKGDETLLLFSNQQGREHSYYVNWNKIYRRDTVLKTIKQLETMGLSENRMMFAEDTLFNFFNYKFADRVVNINSGFYFYRIHDDQISKSNAPDRLKEQLNCMAFALDCMANNIGENEYKEEIKKNIEEWRALMSRTHYQIARSNRCSDIFDDIKKAYHVSKLNKPTAKDAAVYVKAELLGKNFCTIDKKIAELYTNGIPSKIIYEKKCRWLSRLIDGTKQTADSEAALKTNETVIPKRVNSLGDRLIHNPYLYKLGMFLFKKGSKARAFLKRCL